MEPENYLTCSATLEWTNRQGAVTRKIVHKSAVLRLIRNNFRQILVEVQGNKGKQTTKLVLKGISVFKKFMMEGKATIKFQDENCTLFLSNAPSTQLVAFLKTVFVKMTGQLEDASGKHTLREQLLSNKPLGGVQEISPATVAELRIAKEKALAVSRQTITTPSPSSNRKRKLTDHDGAKIPLAKKLYTNHTVCKLTNEQNNVLNAALSGQNIFFTGSAGTGKSFLLKAIIAALPPQVTVATASTGVAACHIGGVTLHQFAGIGIGSGTLEKCYEMASRRGAAQIWRSTKHLIIDEISMVDSSFFEKLEAVARHVRRNDRPFGGIQLILCGDFLQLPPVFKRDEEPRFCFQSSAWDKCINVCFELRKVHRQSDPTFIKLLNSIRIGRVTEEISKTLSATSGHQIEKDGILATRLCTHINDANMINESKLEQLSGTSKVFVAQDSDAYSEKMLDQQLNVPKKLVLKIGAQVMLLKNLNVAKGFVNGARGVVTKLEDDAAIVHFCSGENYKAKTESWTIKTAGGALITRKQLPLKLAWAFSIHKSQGLTLDCVEMSLGRVFDAGQAYVALSRAKNLESLRVLDFSPKQVWANQTVLEFYGRLRRNLQSMEMIPLGKKSKLTNKRGL